MDFNEDDLINNSDSADNNLSIEGMEDWKFDDSISEIGSPHFELEDSGGDGGGGGIETVYGTCAFCDFDIQE